MAKYNEYKALDLNKVAENISKFWDDHRIFENSVTERNGSEPFVFYEGPPSANGKPGIHHVMARTIKDLFCRYQTMKGKQVKRKAGWDTHGLPVELGVEKELGITKEDIGNKISIEDYNKACREAVMRYTDTWKELTEKMAYWVDMDNPYVTYTTKYIETVWWLLSQFHKKDLLYKGYTIQPFSPKAGTGLSSHELNMPGCYRDVKDTSVTAQFKVTQGAEKIPSLQKAFTEGNLYLIAWTTTPWTLPSNTALTVGSKIDYVLVRTRNAYTDEVINIVLAKELAAKQFGQKYKQVESADEVDSGSDQKKKPYFIVDTFKGSDLVGIKYEQLLPYLQPAENAEEAFRVIPGDFVTTEDGTGIVHTAPTFGDDDARVAKAAGVPAMLTEDEQGNLVPLVDKQGKFLEKVQDEVFGLGGEYVKEEYLTEEEKQKALAHQQNTLSDVIKNIDKYLSVDERISIKLKMAGLAFDVQKYEHSYPHCWRTDKPILYYPMDSWFIKSTAMKERMIELNKTINWKPAATGEGRFGNWLENLNDWNLSRSRYWGIPLPVWTTEEGEEVKCIGSVEELKTEIEKAVQAGVMKENPIADFEPGNMDEGNYEKVDLHRPFVDDIVLVSDSGQPMHREKDLIDVWFDSGSMPYAQQHYPFENKEEIDQNGFYPADFIAEGVDQTRGWFFTLHAISSMIFDSVAYKNVVSNGLVLDKNGQKMSKRLGNAVEPFKAMEEYSTDAIRWYMITNAQPWDNLKFDLEGVNEVKRKFFRALYNTYSFFALYANVDGFTYSEERIPVGERPEIDRWVISKLNTLTKEVDKAYGDYEPTKAGRLIGEFVVDRLSNWHVRLSRKRFWRGDYGPDKIAAYQTLYECLTGVAKLAAPIAPFYSDQLYRDLNGVSKREEHESVHLSLWSEPDESLINTDLEERMSIAQRIASMVLALRKKEGIKVRMPLRKIMVPVLTKKFEQQLKEVSELIKTEVNIKDVEAVDDTKGVFVKRIKPDFKALGPKYGKLMKSIAGQVNQFGQEEITKLESGEDITLNLNGEKAVITREDVLITTDDIPGWLVESEGGITVALDVEPDDELYREGLARELVNRIQNLRKDSGLEVTDRINITIESCEKLDDAIDENLNYICAETLADKLEIKAELNNKKKLEIELDEGVITCVAIVKNE